MFDLARLPRPVVTSAELSAAGLSPDAIGRLVGAGILHRRHRGVYAVGRSDLPAPWPDHAALLACGPGSFLALAAAGRVWGVHAPAKGTPIDVASRDGRKRWHAGVRHHRLRVEARDLRTRTGLPLTSPARTLLDLATVLDAHALEQAVVEADIRRLATPTELRELLHRHRPHKGAARLRAIVERGAWQGLTRSEAERIFRGLMQRASLGPLRINPIKAEHRIDVVFERPRVVVEVDGFKTHGRRKAFEDDHGRDARLELAGWHVLRFSARQLTDVPELVVATVASALARVARAPR